MGERDGRIREVDLTPQLGYEARPPRRYWRDVVEDAVDVVGGWVGLAVMFGYCSILVAPRLRSMGLLFIVAGTISLQLAVVYGMKRR